MTLQELIVSHFINTNEIGFSALCKNLKPLTIYLALTGNDLSSPILDIQDDVLNLPETGEIPCFISGPSCQEKYRKLNFQPNDRFRLTEYGQDILYRIRKEKYALWVAERGTRFARQSVHATIIIGIISIILSVLSLCLSLSNIQL